MTSTDKPKLFIHIGCAKCGSTSIQYFLELNRARLLEQGYIIPTVNMSTQGVSNGSQLEYFHEYFGMDVRGLSNSSGRLKSDLVALRDEFTSAKNTMPAIIISAENLSCWDVYYRLFEGLQDEFDVKVIVYIRRQDEYFAAYWQQWALKEEEDFWAWVVNHLPHIGDWHRTLEPWVETFGKENIIVRRFSRGYFIDGNLLRDFAISIGVNPNGMEADFAVNPSFNDGVTMLASSIKDVFDDIHDNRFYEMVSEWVAEKAHKKHQSELMSYGQRVAILNYYAESNERIRKMFFDSDEDKLFEPIVKSRNETDVSASVDGRMEILTRLIYGCYNEILSHRATNHEIKERLVEIEKNLSKKRFFNRK